jgi:hypothetical protein
MTTFQSSGNAIQICDSTTGHSVKNIAFCDTAERAKDIANCYNTHNDLAASIPELTESIQWLLKCMRLAGWENDDAAIFARAALIKAGVV